MDRRLKNILQMASWNHHRTQPHVWTTTNSHCCRLPKMPIYESWRGGSWGWVSIWMGLSAVVHVCRKAPLVCLCACTEITKVPMNFGEFPARTLPKRTLLDRIWGVVVGRLVTCFPGCVRTTLLLSSGMFCVLVLCANFLDARLLVGMIPDGYWRAGIDGEVSCHFCFVLWSTTNLNNSQYHLNFAKVVNWKNQIRLRK